MVDILRIQMEGEMKAYSNKPTFKFYYLKMKLSQ
jgi:hypothetical protein